MLDTQTASIDSLKAGGGGSEFKPCFSCQMPNSQTVGDMARMDWCDVLYDHTDWALNTVGGQFTAKKEGVYLFHVRLLIQSQDAAGGLQYSNLVGNAFSNALSFNKTSRKGFTVHNVSMMIPLNVGEYVFPCSEHKVWGGGNTVKIESKTWTTFSGIWLRDLWFFYLTIV